MKLTGEENFYKESRSKERIAQRRKTPDPRQWDTRKIYIILPPHCQKKIQIQISPNRTKRDLGKLKRMDRLGRLGHDPYKTRCNLFSFLKNISQLFTPYFWGSVKFRKIVFIISTVAHLRNLINNGRHLLLKFTI